jgi:hypothetical protein
MTPPPMITEGIIPDSVVQDARDMMQARLSSLNNIKHKLQLAQERMKKNANKKRSERALEVGDMTYLKMHSYRHTSLGLHNSLKLHSKFYGPFKVLCKRLGKWLTGSRYQMTALYTLFSHQSTEETCWLKSNSAEQAVTYLC